MARTDERRIRLADDADVAGFRAAARRLVAEGVEPGRVVWEVAATADEDLFAAAAAGETLANLPGDAPSGGGRSSLDPAVSAQAPAAPATPINVPAFFIPLCEHAGLHADPGRFGLLYRLLWRLVHEPGLRDDALDPDRLQAEKMARMVRRDMHKMTAFVRFRPIGSADAALPHAVGERIETGGGKLDTTATLSMGSAETATNTVTGTDTTQPIANDSGMRLAAIDSEGDAETGTNRGTDTDTGDDATVTTTTATVASQWQVAWFEPVHHIVAATAPFFARRFAQLKWAILTPERCVRWDGESLAFGPGANRDEAPSADDGEELWLTYYAHIFNPARLKLAMMQKEMPRRYWHNLPEAALIQPLTAAAGRRSGQMVDQTASTPVRRRPAASIAMRIDARAAAANASSSSSSSVSLTLPALGEALNACRECPIGALATQAVPGSGKSGARLMLVGEQPGDQEDLRGQPFVGPAGQLLNRAFAALGWPRDAVFLTNAVKHFKYELRGKRRIHKTASQREAATCLHWLEAEIDLVQPHALVALGATAARSLLGRTVGVTAERGHWLARADGLPVLITLHPSALLRMEPADREAAFQAWLGDLSAANGHVRPLDEPNSP